MLSCWLQTSLPIHFRYPTRRKSSFNIIENKSSTTPHEFEISIPFVFEGMEESSSRLAMLLEEAQQQRSLFSHTTWSCNNWVINALLNIEFIFHSPCFIRSERLIGRMNYVAHEMLYMMWNFNRKISSVANEQASWASSSCRSSFSECHLTHSSSFAC